jgi:hypothetical protein
LINKAFALEDRGGADRVFDVTRMDEVAKSGAMDQQMAGGGSVGGFKGTGNEPDDRGKKIVISSFSGSVVRSENSAYRH